MKARELRSLSEKELQEKLETLHKELMELQFKRRTGVEKPHRFKVTKKSIARILSVLNEKGDKE